MRSESEELLSLQRKLKALPRMAPRADAWPAIRDGLQKQRPGNGRNAALVLAAAIVLTAGLSMLLPRLDTAPQIEKPSTDAAYWMAQSEILQQALLRVDNDHRVLSGAQAQIEAALMRQIAFVDAGLAAESDETSRADALWQRRAQLMVQLLAVRMDANKFAKTDSYGI